MNHKRGTKYSIMETETWKLTLIRKLTDEEWDEISARMNDPASPLKVWDDKGNEFSLPICLFVIQQVCPGVEAKEWHHEPMNILIRSMGLPQKVFVIENAMAYKYAAGAAQASWRDQYGYLGMKAAVITTRLANQERHEGNDVLVIIHNPLISPPEDYEVIANEYGDACLTNFDHTIEVGTEIRLRTELVLTHYAGRNFNGLVWFDRELESFACQVWCWGTPQATVRADTLEKIMEEVSNEWGWE